jgi:hypothetical protein
VDALSLTFLSALAASDGVELFSGPMSERLGLTGIGLGLWGWGGYELRNAIRGVVVEAEVTGFYSFVDRGRDMYRAELRAVIDGQEVAATSQVARSSQSPAVGTKIRARYVVAGDRRELRDGTLVTYVPAAVLCAVGTGMLLAALGVIH